MHCLQLLFIAARPDIKWADEVKKYMTGGFNLNQFALTAVAKIQMRIEEKMYFSLIIV